MSIHTVATHTPDHDTTAHLLDAVAVMTLANVEGRLAAAAGARSPRGTKPTYGAYSPLGFLCAWYEISASHRPFSFKELFETLWFRYTDGQMKLIGLDQLRSSERLNSMQRLAQNQTHSATHKATRANRAEYQRLYEAHTRFLEPMDDTPVVANHRGTARPSRARVAKAATDPALVPKRRLKHEICNAIIAASVINENAKRFPGRPVHEGILDEHAGHIAVDETHAVVGLGDHSASIAPGNYLARLHAHSRPHKGRAPAVVGVTLGIAVARPDQSHSVPDLCLAASIHHPTGGLGEAVITIADAIDANNVRAPRPSNRNQYVVVDGGYTERHDLNRGLNARGYGLIMEYAKDRNVIFEIGAINHDDGDRTPGIIIFKGRPLCPGAGRKYLNQLELEIPKDEAGNLRSGPELDVHENIERRLSALRMPTNGRPEEAQLRPRGGQRKSSSATAETIMRVTLTCPAVNGTARCPIFDDYDDPAIEHLYPVPDAPTTLPIAKRPASCVNASGKMRINIPLDVFKTWQDFMPGTWEHQDWYTAPRSANERYNNLLKRPHGGANLSRGAIAPRKAAPFALAVAVSIANTNRRVMESWDARAAEKNGDLPTPPAHRNKATRNQVLAAHRASKKGP